MHWYDPDVANSPQGAGCNRGSDRLSGRQQHAPLPPLRRARRPQRGTTRCQQYGGTTTAGQLTATDFTAWKMVTIRPPNAGEAPTPFYDLPTLRTAKRARPHDPARRLLHDAGVLRQLADEHEQPDARHDEPDAHRRARVDDRRHRLDDAAEHARARRRARGARDACFGCHQLLDPTRSILSATYSWNYHHQIDPTLTAQPGLFAFQGVVNATSKRSTTSRTTLATHPLFAAGLGAEALLLRELGRLRHDDPEFQRVVGVFKSSNYSWNTLVASCCRRRSRRTRRRRRPRATNGEVVAVSRRDHLCAALNNRLGFTDVCGLDALSQGSADDDDPGDRLRPALGRLRPRLGGARAAQPADALLPRGHREHLRGGRGPGHRRPGRQADRGREAVVEHAARRRHRRLRRIADGASPRPIRARRRQQALLKSHFTAASQAGVDADRRAPVDVRRRVPGAVRRLDRDVRRGAAMITRRHALMSTLFGAGYVGLRALATGLPASLLLNPRHALADRCRRCACDRQGAVHHPQHVGQRRPDQRQRARHLRGRIERRSPDPTMALAAHAQRASRTRRRRRGRRCRRPCSTGRPSGTS